MSKNIVLVGAGNLGIRHTQGLLSLEEPLSIQIIDKNPKQIEILKEFLKKDLIDANHHKLIFTNSFEQLHLETDLVIDATTAKNRYELHEIIQNNFKPNRWIVEKLLSNNLKDLEKIAGLHQNNLAWVNTPRRIMHAYRELKRLFDTKKCINICVNGGNWGIASNSIHFIDLLFFLNEQIYDPILLNLEVLEEVTWINSRRAGFEEALGGIRLTTGDGNFLELISRNEPSDLMVTMTQGDLEIIVNENLGICEVRKKGHIKDFFDIKIELQSLLTPRVVANILNYSQVGLPNISESIIQHKMILGSLIRLKAISSEDNLNIT